MCEGNLKNTKTQKIEDLNHICLSHSRPFMMHNCVLDIFVGLLDKCGEDIWFHCTHYSCVSSGSAGTRKQKYNAHEIY